MTTIEIPKMPREFPPPDALPYASICSGESLLDAKFHKTQAQGLARLRYVNAYITFPRGGNIYKYTGGLYVAYVEWFPNLECIECHIPLGLREDLKSQVLNRRAKPHQWRLIHNDCLRAKYGYDCGGCDAIHLPNQEGRDQALLDYGL